MNFIDASGPHRVLPAGPSSGQLLLEGHLFLKSPFFCLGAARARSVWPTLIKPLENLIKLEVFLF